MKCRVLANLVDLCEFARHGIGVQVVAHAEAYVK